MTNNTPFMYLIGYDREFKKNCNTGWGCGYVAIPLDHPAAIQHFERLKADELKKLHANEDEYIYVSPYFELFGLVEPTTYTETTNIKGVDYLVFGFDTAHSWNSELDDFNFVFNQTAKNLELINDFK